MSKKGFVLLAFAVLLGASYAYWFTDWFKSPTIQILAQIRPMRGGKAQRGTSVPVDPVSFAFNKKHALTEVKVVSVADAKTNKYPFALWHLISESNSVPTKSLVYGMPVKGMKPKVPKARPEPLEPDVPYRLFVTAGDYKGQIDFKTREAVTP